MNIQQILGATCIGLSILMIVKLPNRDLDVLTCDRLSQLCTLERFSGRGEEKVSIPIITLREAEVEKRIHNDRVNYLVVLHTDNERFPLTYNGSDLRKYNLATRVNRFITNSQDISFSEQVEQTHWAKWVFASIVAGLGIKAIVSKTGKSRV